MIRITFFSAAVAILMSFCQAPSAHAAAPEEQPIEAVKVALGKNFDTDWEARRAAGNQMGAAAADEPAELSAGWRLFRAARRGQVRMKTPGLFKSIASID
jgi:hypothetical protein